MTWKHGHSHSHTTNTLRSPYIPCTAAQKSFVLGEDQQKERKYQKVMRKMSLGKLLSNLIGEYWFYLFFLFNCLLNQLRRSPHKNGRKWMSLCDKWIRNAYVRWKNNKEVSFAIKSCDLRISLYQRQSLKFWFYRKCLRGRLCQLRCLMT